jgi:outer membrane cobalamin receptor
MSTVPSAAPVRSGSFGALTSLFLRGGERDYAQVLIDGVPVNDPGGDVDLSNIMLDDVERIEVVRGPASALYGSQAMTGVIQIFTRTGRGPASLSAGARAGSYETIEGELAVARGSSIEFRARSYVPSRCSGRGRRSWSAATASRCCAAPPRSRTATPAATFRWTIWPASSHA